MRARKKWLKATSYSVARGGVSGDVAAQPAVLAVGVDDHGHGIPADEALDLPLHLPIARERRLLVEGDGVDVRRADDARGLEALLAQATGDVVQESRGGSRPLVVERVFHHGFQRLQPFGVIAAVGPGLGRRFRRRSRGSFFGNFTLSFKSQIVILEWLECQMTDWFLSWRAPH